MFSTGETVGLAEWIIDDTPVLFVLFRKISKSGNRRTYGRTDTTFENSYHYRL